MTYLLARIQTKFHNNCHIDYENVFLVFWFTYSKSVLDSKNFPFQVKNNYSNKGFPGVNKVFQISVRVYNRTFTNRAIGQHGQTTSSETSTAAERAVGYVASQFLFQFIADPGRNMRRHPHCWAFVVTRIRKEKNKEREKKSAWAPEATSLTNVPLA